eukprot:gnl/Trimastix_PCT/838.p1 GENE.gnl/Trimastix_PCT/838~~gnl/Trimastix_PCT/838.p1  ORF type:complete len:417 (-),score=65.59 gnl/Trimastix_PCT/838:32-1282(-)
MSWRVGRTVKIRGSASRKVEYILGFIFLVAAFGGWTFCEWRRKSAFMAREEIRPLVREAFRFASPKQSEGEVLHVVGDVEPDDTLVDPFFDIHHENSLRLRRVTEYCQWQEHVSEHKDRDGDTVRTYSYRLGWHRHRISSIFFDQPFAHNNPQRDPFGTEFADQVARTARVGSQYRVDAELLRRLGGFHALPVTPSTVAAFQMSPAAQQHGFQHLGNGWFYSAYDAGMVKKVAQFAGRLLEGSLDIQLGDFFHSCKAGDIRVRFEVADPTVLSAIGLQAGDGLLTTKTTSTGYHFGLIGGGTLSARDLFRADARYHERIVRWARLGLAVWSLVLLHALAALATRTPDLQSLEPARWIVAQAQSGWWGLLVPSLCLTSSLIGAVSACFWGGLLPLLCTLALPVLYCLTRSRAAPGKA